MKSYFHHQKRTITGAILVTVCLLIARTAHPAGLVSGHYQFQVPYSPVCLNGVYPLTVGEMTTGCMLSVNMDANGGLTRTFDLRTVKGATTGSLVLQNNVLSLQLQTSGQDASQTPSQIQAQLHGGQFVGTATTSMGTSPCTLDVSGVAPLTVTFDL